MAAEDDPNSYETTLSGIGGGLLPSDVVATRDISKFVGFIVESFGGNTSAGADFLREAVRRMDISGEGEEGGHEEAGGGGGGSTATLGLDGLLDGDIDGVANTKRVAEADLEDLPRAKAARTVMEGIAGGDQGPIFVGDALDDSQITIVLLVPDTPAVIADIIGKAGSMVAEIEKKTGSQIHIEKVSIRSRERRIAIMGSVRGIMAAQQIITARVRIKDENTATPQGGGQQAPTGGQTLWKDGQGAWKLRLLVPNNIVCHLIGKGGSVISKVQEDSGANLKFQTEADMDPSALGRRLEITGPPRSQNVALYQICRKMVDDKSLPAAWRGSDVFAAQSKLSTAAAAAGGGGAPYGHHHGMMPNRHPLRPPPTTTPAPRGMMPGMDLYHQQQPPQQQQQQQQHQGLPVMASTGGGGGGMAPSHAPLYGQQRAPPPHTPTMLQPINLGEVDGYTTWQVNVPDRAVRFLIGKQGQMVSAVEKQSNAKVEFAKEAAPGSYERVVTVKGQVLAVQVAMSMLSSMVNEWATSPTMQR